MPTSTSVIDRVTFPAHVILAGGTTLESMGVARAIAGDTHPGDDAVGPQHLLHSSVHGVRWEHLRDLVEASTGPLALTPEVLPQLVDLYSDELETLAYLALDEVMDGDASSGALGLDDAALVVVLGALLVEARGPVSAVPRPQRIDEEESVFLGSKPDEAGHSKNKHIVTVAQGAEG
jgi:hypothetical protein